MTKSIVFVFAVICFVNANPLSEQSGASESAFNNNQNGDRRNLATWNNGQYPQRPQMPQMPQFQWPQFQWPQIQWPHIQWPQIPTPTPPMSPDAMAAIKPAPGSVVNGMSSSMTSHTENVGGKLLTKTQGAAVWNENGHVKKEIFGN